MNMIRLFAEVDIESVMNNGMSISERLANGGSMILTIMPFVFGVIFVIWLAQTIISSIVCKAQSGANKKQAEVKEPVRTTAPAPAPEPQQTTSDDDVTVAVITAALSAYFASTSEDGTVLPFRVVSFKRKNSGKPWNS